MPAVERSGYCHHCQRNVLVRRQTPNHLIHALVSLFLCGAWIPIWLLITLFSREPFRCTACGTSDVNA